MQYCSSSSSSSVSPSPAHKRKKTTSTGDVDLTLNREIASLFLNTKFSDVTLKLVGKSPRFSQTTENVQVENTNAYGDQCGVQTVPAHSFILNLRSGYFETRFNFDAAAAVLASNKANGELTMMPETLEIHFANSITASTFMAMLEFLYTDQVPYLGEDSVGEMLVAADFYQVASLHQYCLQTMKCRILNWKNMFDLLLKFHTIYPQMVEAKAVCLDYIDTHFCPPDYYTTNTKFEPAPKFLAVPRELLCEVIRRDSLNICERLVFLAVLKWGTEECKRQGMDTSGANIRQVLGEAALHLVRFPLIDSEWFTNYVVSYNILTDGEILGIFLHKIPNPPFTPFSSVHRALHHVEAQRS